MDSWPGVAQHGGIELFTHSTPRMALMPAGLPPALPGMCKRKLHPRPGGWLLNRGTKPAAGSATAAQRPRCTARLRRRGSQRLSACVRPATL